MPSRTQDVIEATARSDTPVLSQVKASESIDISCLFDIVKHVHGLLTVGLFVVGQFAVKKKIVSARLG